MRAKYFLIAGCILVLGSAVFGLTRSLERRQERPSSVVPESRTGKPLIENRPALAFDSMNLQQGGKRTDSSDQSGDIPEQVVWDELFFNVNFLKAKADETDRQGKDSSGLRAIYKKEAKLNSHESDKLFEI